VVSISTTFSTGFICDICCDGEASLSKRIICCLGLGSIITRAVAFQRGVTR